MGGKLFLFLFLLCPHKILRKNYVSTMVGGLDQPAKLLYFKLYKKEIFIIFQAARRSISTVLSEEHLH